METFKSAGSFELLSRASSCLKDRLSDFGSSSHQKTETALQSVLQNIVDMVSGSVSEPLYRLASLDPGTGKTEAVCAFLRTWKDTGFLPDTGALIVLSTRKEIENCIERSGLTPADFAIIIEKDHEMNARGLMIPEVAPVLFTTQEKLRWLCDGRSFADVSDLHYRGHPRKLRIWDEAFMPAGPAIIRRDTIVQPLEDLRPIHPTAAASLDSLRDSLSADRAGEVVQVPRAISAAQGALQGIYGRAGAERWSPLASLAGQEALVINDGSRGLHLVGASRHLPADFAPALILDASGRVRETYKVMEAAGLLKRLPIAAKRYDRLTINHWDKGASRSVLVDSKKRQEVLEGIADAINAKGDEEHWLVIHPKANDRQAHCLKGELRALVKSPARLSFLHWGNHHGTNDFRHIRKVAVIGLWNAPNPAYAALHIAAGGSMDRAADRETREAMRAGEHRHNLLQAICRASIRQGAENDCEVFLVGHLGPEGREILRETFPGAKVDSWKPEGWELTGSALKVAQALEGIFAGGVHSIEKATLRALLGYRTVQGLAKVLRQEDFRAWATRRSIVVYTRLIEQDLVSVAIPA